MSFRPVNGSPSRAGASNDSAFISAISSLASHGASSQERVGSAGSYPLQKQSSSNSDSQATALSSASTESNHVFTPPIIERSASNGVASSGQGSSQESQLLQLSQLAAAREKMPDLGARSSVKRTADGAVKDPRTSPADSPLRPSSHSRNVSGVSVASTASSRATEVSTPAVGLFCCSSHRDYRVMTDASCPQLSSELKARLSYAMLKLNHGWQSRTIDEVENLASRAGSPASSNSTIPGGARSSASPQIQTSHHPTPHSAYASTVPNTSTSPGLASAPARAPARRHDVPSLAPPVSIQPQPQPQPQPHRSEGHPRRSSNPKQTPAFLSPRSHHDGPHTPAVPSLHISPDNRSLRAAADQMVISPTHNNREKDAMEALLFMSSPGNSANLKTHFPGSQPISSLRNGASSVSSSQRTALPTSAPKRKSLPTGRPLPSSQPLPAGHSPKKRVGFGRSTSALSEMDLDDPTSPRRQVAYARPLVPSAHKVNGSTTHSPGHAKYSMPLSGSLSRAPRPGPRLSYERLDEVLDRVAAEDSSSESDSEIELPTRRDPSGMRI